MSTKLEAKIVYMRDYENKTYEEIAEATGYAPSTMRTYYYRSRNLKSVQHEIKINILHLPDRNIFSEGEAEKTFCVYIINGLDEYKDFIESKVGYTNNFNRRYKELMKSNNWNFIEAINLYYFDHEEDARCFECIARKYFRTLYGDEMWKRNDRFLFEMVNEDLAELNHKLEMFKTFCKETA